MFTHTFTTVILLSITTVISLSFTFVVLLSFQFLYHLMLLSHYPMVQHKIIKTWCTANPAQFPVTHICSIITSSLTQFTSSYHFHPLNFVNLYFCQTSSHHPSLNSIHHIIHFHPQSFVNLYFCQFNKNTESFPIFYQLFSGDMKVAVFFLETCR